MDQYTEFWKWFALNEEKFFNEIEKDTDSVVTLINEKLKNINPELEFEITLEIEEDKRNFIISADGVVDLFDLVISFCKKARDYKYWRIIPFRPSLDYKDVFFTYKQIEMGIDIEVYVRGYEGTDNRYVHIYFLLLDSLVGEYDAVTIIKNTQIFPLSNNMIADINPFPDLLGIIDNLKRII